MIYALIGPIRSGTSAFMDALEAGGLPVARNVIRDKYRDSRSDDEYKMNQGSLNELTEKEMREDLSFPSQYDGSAIKFVVPMVQYMRPHWIRKHREWLPNLYSPGYQVAMIIRNPEEVRQSQAAAIKDTRDYRRLPKERVFAWWRAYAHRMRTVRDYLMRRKDVLSLHVFGYRPIVTDPLSHFERLAAAGWPIDPGKASDVIDVTHYRHRYEKLVMGL